jgi:hypothetical protein
LASSGIPKLDSAVIADKRNQIRAAFSAEEVALGRNEPEIAARDAPRGRRWFSRRERCASD